VPDTYVRDTAESTLSEVAKALVNAQTALSARKPADDQPIDLAAFSEAIKGEPMQRLVGHVEKGEELDDSTVETLARQIKRLNPRELVVNYGKMQVAAAKAAIEEANKKAAALVGGPEKLAALEQFAQTRPDAQALWEQAKANPLQAEGIYLQLGGLMQFSPPPPKVERSPAAGGLPVSSGGASGFVTAHELKQAVLAAEKQYGRGREFSDPVFAARMKATSDKIKNDAMSGRFN
jgi:hypothetical protein